MNDRLDVFCKALVERKSYLLASHVNPEGDAVASVLALESFLRNRGKKTLIVCEDPFPERLPCLPRDRWHQVGEIQKGSKFDALVVADCPVLERIGSVRGLMCPDTEIFNIDHHITNTYYGHHNFVNPEASACGEVIYDVFRHLKHRITLEEATALYVSISTDTGSFKYSNTTIQSHLIASELIKIGIDVERINDDLYSSYSLEKIQLYSLLLAKVETTRDKKIAWARLSRTDLKETGCTYEDTEGFIDFLKYIRETKICFFLTELDAPPPGLVRVSFRSKGDFDVSKVAAEAGGGGHRKAAGCFIQGSLSEATDQVLSLLNHQGT